MATNEADDVSSSNHTRVSLRIQGLQRSKPNAPQNATSEDGVEAIDTSEETIVLPSLPSDLAISALWQKLRELGYDDPISLSGNGKVWMPGCSKPRFEEFEQIKVVQDDLLNPSSSIHADEKLIAYTNRRFGKHIRLNIDENDSNDYGTKIDSLKDSRGLEIMFHRTVRMPDDDKFHQLPGSLGAFPLHSVAAYSDKLSAAIVQAGGVFMPMWQREALWMSLEAPAGTDYALRFFVGRINAVSGLEMNEARDELGEVEAPQDYVIVPGQEWLDGICVGPGIVRQFVAMPLGSGYTVEGQKTGKEKHGGLQIEIIPSFETDLRTWTRDQKCLSATENQYFPQYDRLDEFKSPRELGLGVGDTIRLYPARAFELVPVTLMDMIGEGQTGENDSTFKSTYSWRAKEKSIGSKKSRAMSYGTDMAFSQAQLVDDDYFLAIMDTLRASVRHKKEEGSEHSSEGFFDSCMTQYQSTEEALEGSESRRQPTIMTKDPKAMGLAAGGKLIQDIYRDYNPARIWNTEAARLVHVHILDPASCEAVTHIVPPPPPIDAMGYIEEGGNFFVMEEQPENRIDGGDFDNVKSVSAMDKEKGIKAEPSLDPAQATQCKCGVRLCDCVVRPCDHLFCNVCIREVDPSSITSAFTSMEPQLKNKWFCPMCKAAVSYVAGFSAPMNLPGEESVKVRVPVNVLEVKDGRVAFKSIQRSRI